MIQYVRPHMRSNPGTGISNGVPVQLDSISHRFGHGGYYVNPDFDIDAANQARAIYEGKRALEYQYRIHHPDTQEARKIQAELERASNDAYEAWYNIVRSYKQNPDINNAFPGEQISDYFKPKILARNPKLLDFSNPAIVSALALVGLFMWNKYLR